MSGYCASLFLLGNERLQKTFYIFMFPFFDYIGKWTAYIALFTKVEWKPIPHDYVVDVEKFK